LKVSDEHFITLIELRRDLHTNPELGYQERRTAWKVADRLRTAGLEVTTGVTKTGVIAVLEGGLPGSTIGYRADMDALPMSEQNDVPYCSTESGVMHACGHDVHTTIGVGIAELLAKHREVLAGRFVFVFQPNEEGAPGDELSGGYAMVEDGVLERWPLDAILALHCMPTLDVGKIGHTTHAVWASSDRFEARFKGVQTHGAYPHLGAEPIGAAAELVLAAQRVGHRNIDAQLPVVVSVCQIHAGNQFNVIPEEAWVEGIIRALDEPTRLAAIDALEKAARGVAAANGLQLELRVEQGAHPTENAPALLAEVLEILQGHLPAGDLVNIPSQMGAEDFAAFSLVMPAVYLLLGVRNEGRGFNHMLHSPHFDADERSIRIGVEAMSVTLRQLAARQRALDL